MKYYSVRFKFEDDYYITAYCKANNKKEAFTKFICRYPNSKISIKEKEEKIIEEKNINKVLNDAYDVVR